MSLILSGTDGLSDVDGTAAAPAIRGTDTNTGIFFPAADTVGVATGGSERVRVNSSGNVGIGTTSPAYALDVRGANPTVRVSRSGTAGQVVSLLFEDGNATLGAGSTTRIASDAGAMSFSTGGTSGSDSGGTERVRIVSGGGVRIGGSFTSGASKFAVNNTNNVSGDQNTVFELGTNCNNTSSYHLICSTGGADKLYILGNGNVQNANNSYGAISDIKLKENIVDATPKLADLMQVKVRNYNLIGDITKQIGVIAQELETVFPALVDESPDRDAEGNDLGTTTKSVKYSVFVPMLIKAIQEQQALITALTTRITALEGVA